MKKMLLSAAAVMVLAAAPALAATPDFKSVDTDGNGSVSYEEMIVVMPDASQDAFKSADADQNGELSQEEYDAATKG
ncbi:EF-hand domain-containing protein [Sneathiella sp.]|uniref:EF-hand domain-containing protein n=1 Tax=Sneathiella sp. TaxID=1964365 RepID=UPI003564AC6C